MHVDATVVFQEAQLPELIHEETDARPRDADHVGQRGLLNDLRKDRLRLACFPEWVLFGEFSFDAAMNGLRHEQAWSDDLPVLGLQ